MSLAGFQVYRQVAHDIRSPLNILQLVVGTLNHLTDEQRELFDLAITRIKTIADDILNLETDKKALGMPHDLIDITKNILKEKICEYSSFPHVTFDFIAAEGVSFMSSISVTEYQRVISNLVNNAVEAVNANGLVRISVKKDDQKFCLEIQDNGVGIPASILPKLLKGTFTYGKKNGHGLGLSHAYKNVNSWGGKLEIDSTENVGTLVRIILF